MRLNVIIPVALSMCFGAQPGFAQSSEGPVAAVPFTGYSDFSPPDPVPEPRPSIDCHNAAAAPPVGHSAIVVGSPAGIDWRGEESVGAESRRSKCSQFAGGVSA